MLDLSSRVDPPKPPYDQHQQLKTNPSLITLIHTITMLFTK